MKILSGGKWDLFPSKRHPFMVSEAFDAPGEFEIVIDRDCELVIVYLKGSVSSSNEMKWSLKVKESNGGIYTLIEDVYYMEFGEGIPLLSPRPLRVGDKVILEVEGDGEAIVELTLSLLG
ncbi:MAG: hypothetical protein QJR05_04530 [Thermoanaerobacterium sp.]|nr:hypothetical protein [Thermoanaerobacterium sp.]